MRFSDYFAFQQIDSFADLFEVLHLNHTNIFEDFAYHVKRAREDDRKGGTGTTTRSQMSFRGINFQTLSQKWASLNDSPVVYEYEADENGNTSVKGWLLK